MDKEIDYEKFIHVRNSIIEGRGIFVSVDVPKDSLIMKIEGEVIDGNECEYREEKDNNVYIFWNGDNFIDTSNSPKIKYINHDCTPNCIVDDRDEFSLNLIAACDIKAGEELTIDYGYDEIYDICSCNECINKPGQTIYPKRLASNL